jgi:EAL domain-containing protein (putative c-di-GMP-specific phosphodiesterase class I)
VTTKGRILLVDDARDLLDILQALLEAAGFEVVACIDGEEAIRVFQENPTDAIFTDLTMPRLDGLELIRRIRQIDLDVPIVIVTAAPTMESAIQAVEYGAMRYLLKPVRQTLLIEAAQKAVRLRQMARLKREALAMMGVLGKGIGDRAGLAAAFENALEKLHMHYQPIVSWSQQRVVGWEALVRSGDEQMPHPGALFEAAERLARVLDLTRKIRTLAPTPFEGQSTSLFVNLHVKDLEDDDLYREETALAKMASHVVLEITERNALDQIRDLRARIARLRELGFRIAVDDLGAGYAGLNTFSVLEPDVVKLDMGLVRDVHASPTKQRLVGSMTQLCRDLGMEIVAEGIECVEERDTLIELGCDLFQGFLFARPSEPFPEVAL